MEEIEAKFFITSKDDIRSRLSSIGAQKASDEFLMRRKIYEKLGAPKGDWIRIRQEVDKVTLTFKSQQAKSIDGMLETEVTISDFDKGSTILAQTGLECIAYQENYREIWNHGDAEIVIDTWPWLPTYIEIEASSKEAVESCAQLLGLDMKDARYGTAFDLYAEVYTITNREFHSIPEITFSTAIPEILSKNKKGLS